MNYDEADILTASIVPKEVEAAEVEHSAHVKTITVDLTIIKPVSIIDREYFF